jgi:uncharacterized membrane protein YdcZ (DUF606 family)
VQALFLLLAILAGAVVPIQFAVKSELRGAVGGTITTAAISLLVGTFVLASQVLASIIVDQFSLLNLPVHPASLAGLGGAALVMAGVFVALRT